MNVLVIDNYDSFTYNLVQYLGELGAELEVVRNDVETTARSHSPATSSPTSAASLRTTCSSAPSSPRYWTRL